MSRKPFTRLLSAIIGLTVFYGCCSLPLFDCGPKITEMKVTPENVDIICGDSLHSISFKAWNYSIKNSGDVVYLDVASKSIGIKQPKFRLCSIHENDTTVLKNALQEFADFEYKSRYEIARQSGSDQYIVLIETLPNVTDCVLTEKKITLSSVDN